MALYFWTALALLLVIEGIFPFLSPVRWRLFMVRMIQQSDRSLRIIGLFSMLIGTILMLLVHAGLLFE